jgi:hypothetical protein
MFLDACQQRNKELGFLKVMRKGDDFDSIYNQTSVFKKYIYDILSIM